MTDTTPDQDWPRNCPVCGTALESAVVDFDTTNANHPELRPGEMVAVDFCPNPDCPSHAEGAADAGPGTAAAGVGDLGPETTPGSLGGDNGGG
jgi:hypothetical protein